MTIEAIAPVGAQIIAAQPEAAAPAQAPNFVQWMGEQVSDVNAKVIDAQTALTQLATGETGNLHQVMLKIEEARLAFQLTAQIRNKVLEGYQDIMRMQI